jgi:hypothetical protein
MFFRIWTSKTEPVLLLEKIFRGCQDRQCAQESLDGTHPLVSEEPPTVTIYMALDRSVPINYGLPALAGPTWLIRGS